MWLYFTVLSSEGQLQSHRFYSTQLEHHLEVLNDFVATGFQLLCANLQEDGKKRIDLPIEAFDGKLISHQLLELKTQYELVLSY